MAEGDICWQAAHASSTHPLQTQFSLKGNSADQPSGQHVPKQNHQVDFSSSTTGRSSRSPSVSPDWGNAPSSPYSVPQIAPMPISCRLCPICNTTELTSADFTPNFNMCTQCRTTVCNQCGFNPNPHLTEVKTFILIFIVYLSLLILVIHLGEKLLRDSGQCKQL